MSNKTAIRQVISIAEINRKLKKDGKTPFWNVVTNDGDFYSVFDKNVEPRLELGQANAVMVEEAEVNGKTYRNIVGIAEPEVEGVDIAEIVPNGKPVSKSPQPPATNKLTVVNNMADIRAQALAAAVQLVAHGITPPKQLEDQANSFVDYILSGKNPEHKNGSEGDLNDYIEND